MLDILEVQHSVAAQAKPVGSLTLQVGTQRVALEARTYRSTVLVVVATRDVVVGFVVSTRHRQLVVLQQCARVEDHIHPAHIGLTQYIVILTVGHSNLLLVLDTLSSGHKVPLLGVGLRETYLGLELDFGSVGDASLLGGDYNHTVCSTRTVNRGRCSVLQDIEGCNVRGVDGVEVACRDGRAVKDIQRLGSRVNRVDTTNLHCGRGTGLTSVRQHRQTRYLTLQSLVEGRSGGVFDFCGVDRCNRTCHSALLADTIGDDHHIVHKFGLTLHFEVVGHGLRAGGHEVLNGFETDILERQFGSGGSLHRVGSVKLGTHTAECFGDYRHTDKRLFVFGRCNLSAHSHSLLGEGCDRQGEHQRQQYF